MRLCLILPLKLSLLVFCVVSIRVNSFADDGLLRAIAEGYLESRNAFDFGSYKFELIRGRASSLDQVMDGSLTVEHAAKGSVCWDGDKYRYTLEYDVASSLRTMKNKDGVVISSAPFAPREFLRDNVYTLSVDVFGGMGSFQKTSLATSAVHFSPHGMMGIFDRNIYHTVSSLILEGLEFPQDSRLSKSIWLEENQVWGNQQCMVFSEVAQTSWARQPLVIEGCFEAGR